MSAGTVRTGQVDLWYETFGEAADPPVLVVMGQGAQATGWPTAFCAQLAAAGRFVVRYDNRDTGYSTWFDDDQPYSVEDMAGDAAGLLDGLGIAAAHLVGASLGGAIAQSLAIRSPGRALSLTSIMASAGNAEERSAPADPALLDRFERERLTDSEESIRESVESWRLCAGRSHPFDEAWWWSFVAEQHARRPNPVANAHHRRAMALAAPRHAGLRGLRLPSLIIHGDEDPLVPLAEAETLAQLIPGARLRIIPGMGHELSPWTWPAILQELIEVTAPP